MSKMKVRALIASFAALCLVSPVTAQETFKVYLSDANGNKLSQANAANVSLVVTKEAAPGGTASTLATYTNPVLDSGTGYYYFSFQILPSAVTPLERVQIEAMYNGVSTSPQSVLVHLTTNGNATDMTKSQTIDLTVHVPTFLTGGPRENHVHEEHACSCPTSNHRRCGFLGRRR